jgi:hypothetical protein
MNNNESWLFGNTRVTNPRPLYFLVKKKHSNYNNYNPTSLALDFPWFPFFWFTITMNLTISTGTNLISQDLVLSKAAAIADTQTALDSLVIDLQVALELQPGWL